MPLARCLEAALCFLHAQTSRLTVQRVKARAEGFTREFVRVNAFTPKEIQLLRSLAELHDTTSHILESVCKSLYTKLTP